MDLPLFLNAMLLGLAVAAPVGPMALLVMRSALERGAASGLALGLGIALADGLYGALAAFGVAGISALLLRWQLPLQIAAALFLVWFGWHVVRSTAAARTRETPRRSLPRLVLMALLLTLANPPTIATFAALFTALAPEGGFRLPQALATTAGVFAGSLMWWGGLVALLGALRHGLSPRLLQAITRVSGLLLLGFGLLALLRALLSP